jgi:hypothetical protein
MKPILSNLDRTIRVVAALFAYLYFGGVVTGALTVLPDKNLVSVGDSRKGSASLHQLTSSWFKT